MKYKKRILHIKLTKTTTRHSKNIHTKTDHNPAHTKVTKIIFFQRQKIGFNNPQTQTDTNFRPITPKVTVMLKKVTVR